MWGESRKTQIVSLLQDLQAERLRQAADGNIPDDERAASAAVAESFGKEIDKRKADARYALNVKHIGDPANPFLYESLRAKHEAAVHRARTRARKELAEAGEAITPAAVSAALDRDPEWQMAVGGLIREWFAAGVVDGAAEFERISRLGFETGGAPGAGALLLHAWHEVRRAQEVPGPLAWP